MSLIHNEQTKLTATYLNGVALAVIAVGLLAPLVASLTSAQGVRPITLLAGGVCLVASSGLHVIARLMLRRLRP